MLSSGLNLAMKQISEGNLKPSDNVKNGNRIITNVKEKFLCFNCVFFSHNLVITTMNTKYKVLLVESKKLNGSGLLQRASANNITADKILYEYAIQMVNVLLYF